MTDVFALESRVRWTEKILGLGSSLFFRSRSAGVQRILSSAAWPEERSMTYRHVTWFIHWWRECCSFPRDRAESVDELTSLSQSVKADVRVKTVGFFTSLQTRLETKLVTPWMYHLPSWPRQFRGPPESPWVRDRNSVWSSWPFFISDGNRFSFCCCPHAHCIRTRRLLLHRPWCSWRCRPTSRCDCTHCAPPQAARPAAACQA